MKFNCVICGIEFEQNKKNNITCSKKCRWDRYYSLNKNKLNEYKKNIRIKYKDKERQYYEYQKIIGKRKEYNKRAYLKNPEKRKLATKIWKEQNPDKNWRIIHREQYNEKARILSQKKYKTDIKFILSERTGASIRSMLSGKQKGSKKLHYDINKLIVSLCKIHNIQEDSLLNYIKINKLELDHRIPQSWFNYKTTEDEEFKLCWSIENLWLKEKKTNQIKSNNFAEPTEKQLRNPIIQEVLKRNGFK